MSTTTADLHASGTSESSRSGSALGYLVPVGRALFALIFITGGLHHFSRQAVGYAAAQHVPWPALLVPVSGVMALGGGLSVLLGYKAKLGAWVLVLFLVPVTLMMHAFWAEKDAMMAQMQQVMFMKNLALLGAALLVAHFGAGPMSLDARSRQRH